MAHIAIEHHVHGLRPCRIAQQRARLQGSNPLGLPVGIGLGSNNSLQIFPETRIGREVLERAQSCFEIGFSPAVNC